MVTRNIFYLLCLVATFFFTSCEHKELCYNHPHTKRIRVEFDWRDAPQASPQGMCVFFYPTSDEDRIPKRRFDFSGKNGGEIEIELGTYRVICYNNDTEAVQFRGISSFDTHEAYTREGNIFETIYGSGANFTPSAKGEETERVVICPDMTWGCSISYVTISENGINYLSFPESEKEALLTKAPIADEYVLTLYPHETLCTYTYEIRNVKNLKYTTQMCGSLSGMAPSMLLGNEELTSECVTIPFEASADRQSTITGRFLTFGHNENNTKTHYMLLYVWFTDGSKYYYTFDITSQIHSAPDKRRVHIIIDELNLPQPITNGNGFKPSVDDWYVVEGDIIM